MRRIFIVGVFCFVSVVTTLYGMESEKTKKQIEKRLQDFIVAINQHQGESLPTFWAQDAILINPAANETYKGKMEINDYLQKRNQEIQKRQLNFAFTPTNITFPEPNQAIVEGVVEIKEKGQLIERDARKIKLVNQNNQWYIKELREIEVAPAPSAFSHLKELEWLIGKWKDGNEDVTITFSAKWDKFKNFILQNFKMETYGLEAIEGFQIIGWDPIEENIHSWVYDSDGGFGEGIWNKQNNGWQVTLNYVLSDGSEGTATNVYTNINDKSYRYSSIDRSLDGESLDNIPPVTVKKE